MHEIMLIMNTGADRLDPAQDAFNSYLSQLRIYMEMAFGRLVNMLKIVDTLDTVITILTACAQLHNFIIKEDELFEESLNSIQEEMESFDITHDPIVLLRMSYLNVITDESFHVYSGISHTRVIIVEFYGENENLRSAHNIKREKREVETAYEMAVVSPSGFECDCKFVSFF